LKPMQANTPGERRGRMVIGCQPEGRGFDVAARARRGDWVQDSLHIPVPRAM
jgi:hypothetical protein